MPHFVEFVCCNRAVFGECVDGSALLNRYPPLLRYMRRNVKYELSVPAKFISATKTNYPPAGDPLRLPTDTLTSNRVKEKSSETY